MNLKIFTLALILIFFALPSGGLLAQYDDEYEYEDTYGEATEEDIHEHHIALFLGAASNLDHNTTDYAVGIDYEYRLNFISDRLGTGVFVEAVFAEYKEQLFGIPIFIHIGESFKFTLGFGAAVLDKPTNPASGEHYSYDNKGYPKLLSDTNLEHSEAQASFLFRLGAGYDFHFDNLSVAPVLNFDFFDGQTSIVYGITLGIGL